MTEINLSVMLSPQTAIMRLISAALPYQVVKDKSYFLHLRICKEGVEALVPFPVLYKAQTINSAVMH